MGISNVFYYVEATATHVALGDSETGSYILTAIKRAYNASDRTYKGMVREFNNLIMASAIAAKGDMESVTSLGYTTDMLIRKDELSVLLFKLVKKKVVNTVSLEIDDEGFAVESIDDTIQKQNIVAETLYAKLYSED